MTEHTPGPWVQFADEGKCIAIMPAGRDGDICTFRQPPSDADARLMTLAPALLKALRKCASRCRYDGDLFHDQGNIQRRDASWKAGEEAEDLIAAVGNARVSPHE